MHIRKAQILGLSVLMGVLSVGARSMSAVSVDRMVAPVLVGIDGSPVEKITLIGNGKPYSIDRIALSFSGTTDMDDIRSVRVYGSDKKGNIDRGMLLSAIDMNPRSGGRLISPISVDNDTVKLWIGVTLADSVDLKHKIAVTATLISTSAGKVTLPESDAEPMRVGVAVRQAGQDGVTSSRIPGIATTNKGTLLAIFDARYDSRRDLQGNIDIGMHRSSDGGTTWQPMQIILDMGSWGGLPEKYNGVSDACILVDKNTGDIFVAGLWMHGALDDNGHWIEGLDENSAYWIHQWHKKGSQPGLGIKQTSQFMITKSMDDGHTWSLPHNITPDTKREEWWLFAPAPGQGITLTDGTLVFPTQGRDKDGHPFSNITYSCNHGKSWTASNPAFGNVTECNAVQLENGDVMLNMRDNRNRGVKKPNGRRVCCTSDLGNTWSEHVTSHNVLTEPTCMAALHSHEYTDGDGQKRQMLLFSNPNHHKLRKDMTLKVSFDDGMTWPEDNWIMFDQTRGAGYSSITSVNERTIGLLYESGLADLVFVQIDIDEILKPNK